MKKYTNKLNKVNARIEAIELDDAYVDYNYYYQQAANKIREIVKVEGWNKDPKLLKQFNKANAEQKFLTIIYEELSAELNALDKTKRNLEDLIASL